MTREEIINGLKMSMDLTLFDPSTGEVMEPWQLNEVNRTAYEAYKGAIELLEEMPSAQPERTCVNCGRTANNGGWYADGRTRCPIEEHYALPKDGFCHLWEKRNIADDDYPERRPSIQPDTTTYDSIPAKTGKNDDDGTSGDCISRRASLEKIRTMQTYKLFAGDDMILIDKAQVQTELMMLPPVQPEQRWIPCSERQPDKGGDYLVTLWDDGRTWVEIALWNETFGGRWQAVLYNDVDYSDISNVIAWKPLPEPYQEGGEHK